MAEWVVFRSRTPLETGSGVVTPGTGTVAKVTLTVSGGKGNISLASKGGTPITTGTYSYALYQYAPGQDDYVKVDEGTYTYGVTPAFTVTPTYSYYVVVDGVTSNIVRG